MHHIYDKKVDTVKHCLSLLVHLW